MATTKWPSSRPTSCWRSTKTCTAPRYCCRPDAASSQSEPIGLDKQIRSYHPPPPPSRCWRPSACSGRAGKMRPFPWPRRWPPWSPRTTTLYKRSPSSTGRCIDVRAHLNARTFGGGSGRINLACACVGSSWVGDQIVRGGGEEGPAQRGVPLAPLHGVRARRRVQEDAAGEDTHAHTHGRAQAHVCVR